MKKRKARNIFKRSGSPYYWIRYTIDGMQIRESSEGTNYKDAELLLAKRMAAGKKPETKKLHTFRELAGKYLSWTTGRQRSAQTKSYVIGQLVSVFGDTRLKDFNTLKVEQLQTTLISQDYEIASINKILNIFKHMFSKAVEWELTGEDVLRGIRKVKSLKGENRRLRFLTQEECHALINACESYLKPVVITAMNTGMRKSEILTLQWDNVDLKHGFILLDKTKNGERREIPLSATVKAVLQGITRRLDIPYVFFDSASGKPFQNVKRSFHSALRRAKITDFKFHDLRHTFASHLVMSGVDLTTVKELLGHKDIKMTLRYSHLAPEHKLKAVDILDKTLNGNTISTKLAQYGG
ncbi:MAG: site-specific integrase [Nitrospiraceae bacterium]|nr:MAG: site-specific integrase [Nitrospiraceae bacterium]